MPEPKYIVVNVPNRGRVRFPAGTDPIKMRVVLQRHFATAKGSPDGFDSQYPKTAATLDLANQASQLELVPGARKTAEVQGANATAFLNEAFGPEASIPRQEPDGSMSLPTPLGKATNVAKAMGAQTNRLIYQAASTNPFEALLMASPPVAGAYFGARGAQGTYENRGAVANPTPENTEALLGSLAMMMAPFQKVAAARPPSKPVPLRRTPDYARIIEAGGGKFRGFQQSGLPNIPDLVLFDDFQTRSTLAMPINDPNLTPTGVQQHIAVSRAKFKVASAGN